MTSDASTRRTANWVASLWIVTAIGAIGGLALMSPVLNAPDYLTSVFPRSAILISAALLWLINDIGIVAIGVLMFPILKKQSEALALGYVSMRMFESIFLIIGMTFAMLLIPLSQAYIQASAADLTTYQAIGSLLKQAENWLMTVMQLIEALRLDEHLVAVEHTGDAGLTRLEAFVLAVLAGLRIVRRVLRRLLVA